MSKKYNWGIIGLGNIAHKFSEDLILVEDANLFGVASRNSKKAKSFSEKFQVDKHYGSYQELADDPQIDVVYIATPHPFHFENTMMCLEAGKAVLCEKAFGMNEKEVKQMIAKAKEKNLFLMEALWTRFIPATEEMIALLNKGLIGDLKTVRADFGFKAEFDADKRLYNKKLGGGALLDIGIYPVFLSLLTLGKPKKINASAQISSTGVDENIMMLFNYSNKQTAILDASLVTTTPVEAWLHGDKGSLKMHRNFHHSEEISYFKGSELVEKRHIKYVGNGYFHEIVEVMKCLKTGKIESEKLPHSFSLDLINTLDRIREVIGLQYNE